MSNNINPKVQFTKIRKVKSPVRATPEDAGTDWYIPDWDETGVLQEEILKGSVGLRSVDISIIDGITIESGVRVKIPSGIKVNILDKRTYLKSTNKSGQSSKKGLDVLADTIDAGYQGECNISIVNTGNEPVKVNWGEKIVQMIQLEYIPTEYEEISNEEYDNLPKSVRGEGGFGHNGLN